ncbi:glycosyltransferase family 2 protein [Vibrio harveyi]|uniref:glycosyltransferase family 2 protein n=1 Tax=Vibrio harveyi TaxID=669 RepID=UPI00238083DF|nr:glycosyltransferase family 2 protein [Vibrio harveyi]
MYTVIIPFFNQQNYVSDTMTSVLSAICYDDEIVVIDDCSTDSTYLELMKFNYDPRVKVFKNIENMGHVKTLNKAARIAKGEVLVLLGGDDLLGNGFCQWLSPHFSNGADIVFSPVEFFENISDVNTNKISKVSTIPLGFMDILFGWGKAKQRKYSIIGCAIRKTSFEFLEGFSEDVLIEDHDLFIRASQKKLKILSVGGSYSFYRKSSGSLSSNMRRMIIEDFRVIEKNVTFPLSFLAKLRRVVSFTAVYLRGKLF